MDEPQHWPAHSPSAAEVNSRDQGSLIALFIVQVIAVAGLRAVFPFMPLYVQSLGISETTNAIQWAAAISAATSFTTALGQPVWGHLSDRFGAKSMLVRSIGGQALAIALMGFATSAEQLFVLGLLHGLSGGVLAASYTLVTASTARRKLGSALGMLQVALFVGTSVGPFVGGAVADTLGYRTAFQAVGATTLVPLAIVVLFVHDHRAPTRPGVPPRGFWADSKSILQIATFPVLISVLFLIAFGNMIVHPVLSPYVAELSADENAATMAGMIMAATGVTSALSALTFGRLADRFGHARVLSICLLGSAITYYPQALVDQVWQVALLRSLLGVFLGGLMPVANAMVGVVAPAERRGAAFGLTAAGTSLASGVAPLAGAAVTTFWGMRAVFLATGILYTLAFGWVSLQLPRHRAPTTASERP